MHDGDTFEHNGNRFRVAFPHDCDHEPPWEAEDGHGPVYDWSRSTSKAPGERVLIKDHGHIRVYDFAEACRIARRDGWGFLPYKLDTSACEGGFRAKAGPFSATAADINAAIRAVFDAHRATFPTARAYAAAAAEADFKRLKAWCDNQWSYIGVVVTLLDDDGDATDESASLWGVESDAGDYLEEVARELAGEITASIRAAMGAEA